MEFNSLLKTVIQMFDAEHNIEITKMFASAQTSIEITESNTWDYNTYNYYSVYISIDVETYTIVKDKLETIESSILEKFTAASRHNEFDTISKIIVIPRASTKIEWTKVSHLTTREKLNEIIQYLRNTLISVSTGGPQIKEVNDEYKRQYKLANQVLGILSIKNPNPYKDLWGWYGKYHTEIGKYQDRRVFITNMYSGLIDMLNAQEEKLLNTVNMNISDWDKLERKVSEIKIRQDEAKTEEQFQVVGLLCRESIISLAQEVYNKDKHPSSDGKDISKTDSKRMLDAYITVQMSGSSKETVRKYVKATIDLANELTHKRSATTQDSALCITATITLINIIGIIEGKI